MGEHQVAEAALHRAVFLDRDGVLNRALVRDGKPYPPDTVEEFELLPGVEEACALLKKAGFLLVVVTNQPDVGRGTQSLAVVEAMHRKMGDLLPLDRIETCYEPGGAPSERRKPAPGMLLSASRELGINLEKSYMVGDRWRDIDAGAAAGCAATFFIDCGYEEDLRAAPDYKVASLLQAAKMIVNLAEV
jgi:D-glycero-D-manno-heptose 1,7-bisphosphate phosphatase